MILNILLSTSCTGDIVPEDKGNNSPVNDSGCENDSECDSETICEDSECIPGDRNNSSDEAEGLLYGGRLESAPMGKLAALTPDEFRIRLGGGAVFEDSATVDTLAYSGDLHLEYKYVRLRGEYLKDIRTPDVEPILPSSLKGEVERQSIVGELTSFVIADRLELAFRYETYDSNLDVEDWGDTEIFVGGINGYIYGQNLKVLLNYIYKNESGGSTLDNDALLLSFGGAI